MSANGNIKKLSNNRPISVSTLINFLQTLYKDQDIATVKPIHGIVLNSYNMYTIELKTKTIDRIILKFNFSLKNK